MDQLELVDGKLYLVVAPLSLLLGLHAQVDGQLYRAAVTRSGSRVQCVTSNGMQTDRQTDGFSLL